MVRGAACPCGTAVTRGHGRGGRGLLGARLQRLDQVIVAAFRERRAGSDHFHHLADAIDHGENGADQSGIGLAAAGADVGERVLGRVAQRFKAREVEEAAIALHRVDKAKNAVEPGAVLRRGLPGDDLPAEAFQHVPAFGDEIGNQVVHGPTSRLLTRAWG